VDGTRVYALGSALTDVIKNNSLDDDQKSLAFVVGLLTLHFFTALDA
jgi:hypothetical protein